MYRNPALRVCAAMLAVGALAAGACGTNDTSTSPESSASTAETASDDSSAQDATAEARSGFYADSTWPSPASDLWRTSAVAGDVGLAADTSDDELVASSVEVGPAPMFGVTYGDDYVFVSGGTPFLLDLFSEAQGGDPAERSAQTLLDAAENTVENSAVNPFVAKVNVDTMNVETIELEKGSTVNYVGGLLAHENGKLYAVATSRLFEIDPAEFEVTRSVDLPTLDQDTFFTTYNGLQVSPTNGDIILKMADFSGRTNNGAILAVDPSDLTIRTQTNGEIGTARMTMAVQNGTEYLYIPGPTETSRYAVTPEGFQLDPQWGMTYRSADDGSTQAVSFVYTGNEHDTVVFNSNNTIIYGVTAPLRIYTQSTTDSSAGVKTFNAVDTTEAGGNFFNIVGDPYRSGMFVAIDVVNGLMAGWSLGDDGSLTQIWETDRYKPSAGPAIAADRGHLYTDTRECDADGQNCTFYLLAIDLATGEEITRSEVAATMSTIGRIMVGPDSVYYIASEIGQPNGLITRVTTE